MKLTTREDSKNYAATVVKLPPKQAVPGLDKLVKVTVFGNDVLTQKTTDENSLYLFFPAECAISAEYLSKNNEFRESTLNKDQAQTGYFEPSGRVKAIKFKGVISTGYLAPISTLNGLGTLNHGLKEGDEFTDINDINICKKYIPKHLHTQGTGGGGSKHNKKLKRFDKLVPNQFRFHNDTAHLAKNLHLLNPEDIIVITDKWHGTSAVFANVLTNQKIKWYESLVAGLAAPFIKKYLNFKGYDNIYSSRSVVKNQYINKEVGPGYYGGEDIWGIVNKELEGKIEQGITLYGEIVGFLPSGRMIQKGYDYGCSPGLIAPPERRTAIISSATDSPEHKFLVYRITYTKPNGEVIEFSWQQIKEYCKKYSIEHVKELYFGSGHSSIGDGQEYSTIEDFREKFFNYLTTTYLEKDCTHCKNKVPAEGICVRIDGKPTYSTFKLKSKRFLERETKSLDAGEVSIEDEQVADA